MIIVDCDIIDHTTKTTQNNNDNDNGYKDNHGLWHNWSHNNINNDNDNGDSENEKVEWESKIKTTKVASPQTCLLWCCVQRIIVSFYVCFEWYVV